MNGRHWWRYSTIIIFSNFEPNIFGWKVSVRTLWKYQNSNFLILKRIFLAEKSVNNEILGFPTGTLWKYQNSDFSNFEANIFGCELSVRI
jgi:hypothetical protein